jgi:diphosphomevalonate decarboxylase
VNYHELYLKESKSFDNRPISSHGSVAWESPSNIALVKYWGKKHGQLPMNPSLSFTLSESVTRSAIFYTFKKDRDKLKLKYLFNGEQRFDFELRIRNYLDDIGVYLPFLRHLDLEIKSENSFPHSAGIASSASAFSSLALCLLDIGSNFSSTLQTDDDFFRKASFLSRIGSGSAARSVYGGAVIWGRNDAIINSSDEIAITINELTHSIFTNFYDIILILDDQKKAISSSKGHSLMNDNPYAEVRYTQARTNLTSMLQFIRVGDVSLFYEIAEYEALTLQALLMTSYPGFILMKPSTLAVIERIKNFRMDTGNLIGFTLDAGANIHILFPAYIYPQVIDFVDAELSTFCVGGKYITDQMGKGPKRVISK